MADYYQVRNENVFNPPANTNLGNASNQFGNVFVQNNLNLGNVTVTSSSIITPKVSTITYPGDDTAADTAGGQTITLTGSGFTAGASVLINGSAVGIVSVVSSTTITFTSPANITGSYVIYVINPDGATAISIPGIQYSGTPNWTTAAGSLGSLYETNSFNQTLTATGDAPITYSVTTGSLPPGATFNSNGTITGTSSLLSSPTTYTFTVRATDAQQQDTDRSFSLVINPDVVTWSSPANGTTYTSPTNSTISNVVLSATSAAGSGITYTANSLPVGLSLSGNTISGTPTVEANSSSLLTATASTTSESSSVTINWVISVANDIYFKYNTLLLPGASTTYVDDASTNNFAITIIGDTKPNSMNPYSPGYYSNYFDGTSDYLQIANNTALNLSGGDFTLEAWVYVTVLPPLNGSSTRTACIMQYGSTTTNQGYEFTLDFTNNRLSLASIGTGNITDGSFSFALNTWYHVAATKSGSTNRLFVNGTSLTLINNTFPNNSSSSGFQRIGSGRLFTFYDHDLTGYISNARIVKGTAVYTANFTPSTTPLTTIANTSLLICQSNRFIDNSTNAFTITVTGDTKIKSFQPFTPNSSYSSYGSGYFDGSGDYLITPSSDAFNLGTGDFTYEAWIYPINNPIWGQIVGPAYNANGLVLFCHNRALNAYASGTVLSWDAIIQMDAWQHVVVTRQSGIISLYHNGVKYVNTVSFTGSLTNNTFYIGANSSGGETFTGHITDVRVVKGTAVYTTTFTPPSQPLTAISGTSLLTLQNNQSVNNNVFLDNSTNNFLVTRNGNATQGTFSPYGGNWSNYFDGTGDYLSLSSNSAFDLGTEAYTVEAWVYLTSYAANEAVMFCNGNSNGAIACSINTGGQIYISKYGSGQVITGSAGDVPLNQWNHLAYVRSSTASNGTRLYVNGVLKATGTDSNNWNVTTTPTVGALTISGFGIIGNISNVRVVKGTAVYTTTFTPSTTPLTVISGTSLLTCQSNRLIDNSINNFTITKNGDVSVQRFSPFNPSSLTPTSYSGYFDGTGDYLNTPSSSSLGFGTSDFTIEMWVYSGANGTGTRLGGNGTGGSWSSGNWILATGTPGNVNKFCLGVNNTGSDLLVSTSTFNNSQWMHVAITRSGNSWAMFVNGVRESTATSSVSLDNGGSKSIYLGQSNIAGDTMWAGYISNFRVVIGTAVYSPSSTTITVPTAPLTAISGTQLLTCQSTTFIDNSTNNFTITAAGDSKPTIQNPFGYTSATTNGYSVSTIGGSAYYDGSGDSIASPQSATFNLSSGNWTIEAWYYSFSILGQSARYLTITPSSGTVIGVLPGSGGFILNYFGSSSPISTSIPATLNAWQHIALVKNGSTTTLYINGVAGGSGTPSWVNADTTIFFGGNTGSYAYDYSGYISDARVVKGTALYTSNFVPPSQPLLAIQNTSFLLNMTNAGIYDAAMMNDMETVGDAKLSTAVTKFGGSSMSFDGTGDRLVSASSIVNTLSNGDFTIEFWLYPSNTSSAYRALVSSENYPATTGGWSLYQNGAAIEFWMNGSASATINATSAITASTWQHLALCRASGTLRLFINGTSVSSVSHSTSLTGQQIWIGDNNSSGGGLYFYNGYMDDLRITKGYARYTSNFTAPTQALQTF